MNPLRPLVRFQHRIDPVQLIDEFFLEAFVVFANFVNLAQFFLGVEGFQATVFDTELEDLSGAELSQVDKSVTEILIVACDSWLVVTIQHFVENLSGSVRSVFRVE